MVSFGIILSMTFFGNSVGRYAAAAAVFLVCAEALQLLQPRLLSFLRAQAARTRGDFDDVFVAALSQVGNSERVVVALYVATRLLVLGPGAARFIHLALVAVLSLRATAVVQEVVVYLISRSSAFAGEDPNSSSVLQNLRLAVKALVWTGGALFVLDNAGVHVGTAVAGLGIGGVAVAMAGQQVLGDLFSSLAIFMDKPFRVGDAIVVDDLVGTVERIGIKTSRVRGLGGEMLIFSNSDLTRSRVRNYRLMKERRVVFSFGVTYGTPCEKVAAIPGIARAIIAQTPKTRFDRAHFKGFGDSSLDFEAVYYVLTGDYNVYMDVRQSVSLELMRRFQGEGIEFAFPTRTVYLAKP
ncbi:MAG: mechanosensitive ion channel family protein [Elusimicrobia bacterium]|nr:mechanosensitive ion channel family protein [Elusimicrobiota bacterium]